MLSEQEFCMICVRAFMAFKNDSESQKNFCRSDGKWAQCEKLNIRGKRFHL